MARDASIGVNIVGRDRASGELRKVGMSAEQLGKRMNDVSNRIIKGMGLAAAAAGAVAVKIGVDSVKAAIEDKKSVDVLVRSLRNSTKATRDQALAVDEYLGKQQARYGFEDTELRSGLSRLARSTHDVKKSQDLLTLAMNVSAGTGKSLDTVVAGIAKAYDGNLGALGRLGVGITKSTLKSKDFKKAVLELRENFKGFATVAANSFEGRIKRARIAVDEAKESLGYFIIQALQPFAEEITKMLPSLQTWVDTNGPKIRDALKDSVPKVKEFVGHLVDLGRWAYDHKDTLWDVAKAVTAIVVGMKTFGAVTAFSSALAGLATTFGIMSKAAGTAAVAQAAATGGLSVPGALAGMAGIAAALGAYGVLSGAIDLGGDKGKDTEFQQPESSRWKLNGDLRMGSNGVMGNYWNAAANIGGQAPIVINVHGSIFTEDQLLRQLRNGLRNLDARNGK